MKNISINKQDIVPDLLNFEGSTTLFMENISGLPLQVELVSQHFAETATSSCLHRVSRLYFTSPQRPVIYAVSSFFTDKLLPTELELLLEGHVPVGKLFINCNANETIRKLDVVNGVQHNAEAVHHLGVQGPAVWCKRYEFWVGNRQVGHVAEYFTQESLSRV